MKITIFSKEIDINYENSEYTLQELWGLVNKSDDFVHLIFSEANKAGYTEYPLRGMIIRAVLDLKLSLDGYGPYKI